MEKCVTKVCNEKATFKVFWPGKTVEMCSGCMAKAEGLAQVMGFDLKSEPIAPLPRVFVNDGEG